MAQVAETKLGPCEIISPLGAGGMGEVYRDGEFRAAGHRTRRTDSRDAAGRAGNLSARQFVLNWDAELKK